jgi:DNA polymerase-1
MIITMDNLRDVLASLGNRCAIDSETTGFNAHKGADLFSIIISDEKGDYYFNFQDYGDGSPVLSKEAFGWINQATSSKPRVWFLQNAKFDMSFLDKVGITLNGMILDLMFLDRLHNNQHMSYRLADIAKRWGEAKEGDAVEEWLGNKKNGAVFDETCPISGKEYQVKQYQKVPFSIISKYGLADGKATFGSGTKLIEALHIEEKKFPQKPLLPLVHTEAQLTRTLYDMEKVGVQIDVPYCKEALVFFKGRIQQLEATFKSLTGLEYKKGTTVFEEVFKDERDKWKKTEKGNWRWDASIVGVFKHPAAKVVIELAEAKKQSDYFANFLFHCDGFGVLHTNFKQSGTVTGRLSSADVNLQNLTSADKYDEDSAASIYPVRKAFIPRPGFFFVMCDYSQNEFRLLLDYARPKDLVQRVLSGEDVHTATATVAGVSRKEAKTVLFLSIYGGGVAKLVSQLYTPVGSQDQVSALFKQLNGWRFRDDKEREAFLTCTEEMKAHDTPLIEKAYSIQQSIFRAAPEIKQLLKSIQAKADERGVILNWAGRRLHFPDKRWTYTAPNHLIQGGSADIMKIALNRVAEYLADKKSRMVLTIHDEIILECAHEEAHEVPEQVCKIMSEVYPYKVLPQVADIGFNMENLAEKIKWVEFGKTGGDATKGTSTS